MTREETKKCIEVMRAFLEGKEIQMYSHVNKKWEDNPNPSFQWGYCDYRIKPEEQTNFFPATKEELEAIELLGLAIKHKADKNGTICQLSYLRLLPDGSNTPKDLKDNYLIFDPITKTWQDWKE